MKPPAYPTNEKQTDYELLPKSLAFSVFALSKCSLNNFASTHQYRYTREWGEWGSGTFRVTETDGEGFGCCDAFADVGGDTVYPASITSNVLFEFHVGSDYTGLAHEQRRMVGGWWRKGPTVVVCADFQGLVSSHDKTCFLCGLVFQEFHVPCTSFFPFICVLRESE